MSDGNTDNEPVIELEETNEELIIKVVESNKGENL